MPAMPAQLKSADVPDFLNAHVCAGPVGRVVVGVAGAGGGAQPDPSGGGEDAVCQLQRRQATTTAQHKDGQT